MTASPPSTRATARLVARREIAVDQLEVVVSVPPAVAALHTRPGQFVVLAVQDAEDRVHEGFFAMWSAPHASEATLRFLLRMNAPEGGDVARRLAAIPEGTSLGVSAPMGAGFPLDEARGRHLAFVATGTAYAPIAACIEHLFAHPVGALDVSLDLGVRSPAHLADPDALERFRARGVEVAVSYSAPTSEGAVRGALVQDTLLDRLLAQGRLADTLILAAGHDAMLESLRARHRALGGDPRRIATNH